MEEEIIAVARQMNRSFLKRFILMREIYDMLFTNRGVIAVETGKAPGFFAGTFIGTLIAGLKSRKKSRAIKNLSLSELLTMNINMKIFNYAELDLVAVKPSRMIFSEIIIIQRNGKSEKFWGEYRNIIDVHKKINILSRYMIPIVVLKKLAPVLQSSRLSASREKT